MCVKPYDAYLYWDETSCDHNVRTGPSSEGLMDKRLMKRTELVKAHEAGKLSNSYYTYKDGKKYLSPSKLRKEGF